MFRKLFCLANVYEIKVQDEVLSLTGALDASLREEILRLPEKKRASVLSARLLLILLLRERAHLRREELIFSRDGNSKPYLSAHPEIFFNVTHTDTAAAAAIYDRRIGIDAEGIRPVSDRLLFRCFTEEERASLSLQNREREVISLWTKKEAYSKMIGKGLSLKFGSFSTLSPDFKAKIITQERENYMLSVCTDRPAPIKFEEKTMADFERFFSAEIVPKKD